MVEERVRTTDTSRVESFSDGVVAIALTLLVLDLIVAPDIADQRAAVAVYVVVSLIVAVGWAAMSSAIARRPALVGDRADLSWFRANARLSAGSGVVAVLGGGVGWFAPVAALVVFLLVPAVFFAVTLRAARRS